MYAPRPTAPLLAGALLVLLPADGRGAPDPPRVRGVVVDAAGEPVAGAAVGTVSETGPAFTLTTDANGRFALPEKGYPAVIARGPAGSPLAERLGYAAYTDPESAGEEWAPQIGEDGAVRITLAPPRTVPVTVTGPDGPAAGVTVYAVADFDVVGVVTTGADGTATFTLPEAARVSQIIAVRRPAGDVPGLYAHRRLGPDHAAHDEPTERPDRLDLAVVPTFAHTVTAVTKPPGGGDAVPVAGAGAYVWLLTRPDGELANLPSLPFNDARTGPDGAATFDWLPRDLTRLTGWVRADGFEGVRFVVEEAAAAPGQTVELIARGTLTGVVRHIDGTPARGVIVRAVGSVPGPAMIEDERDHAVTDAAGRYAFEVPGGALFLVQALPGVTGPRDDVPNPQRLTSKILGMTERNAGGELVSAPGEAVELPDLLLVPGTPVRGAVRDDAGNPKPGVKLTLQARGAFPDRLLHPDSDDPAWTGDPYMTVFQQTDAAGRYEFRAPPGEYSLYAAGADRPAGGWQIEVTADPFERDWTLKPPRVRTYAGRALGLDGEPVAGATARIAAEPFNLDEDAAASAVTGADGAFSLTLEGDAAALQATAPDPAGGGDRVSTVASFRSAPTHSREPDRETYDGIELVVRPTTVLTGNAVLDLGVTGYAGVPVSLDGPDLNDPHFRPGGPLETEMTTGPRGRWVFLAARAGLTHRVYGPPDRGTRYPVNRAAAAGESGPTDLGTAWLDSDELELPPVEQRRAAAFRAPVDVPRLLTAYRTAAAALGKRVLVLVADPDSDAGADLFAAVYDDFAPAAAADAAFLTLCLPPGPAAEPLGVPAEGPARVFVLDPAGAPAPVAEHRHEPGDRDRLVAFLKATP